MQNVPIAPARAEALLPQLIDRLALAMIAALTLYRVALGLFDATELSADEAQYWVWGQEAAFGAYSKPPLIGWLIRVSTELLGQSIWAVRFPAALIHAATALCILALGRRIATPAVAGIAAIAYLTTPAVALGSALMTTDTPLLLASVLALLAQHGLGRARIEGRHRPWLAVGLGLAVALGFLAKQAMVFAVLGMAAASLLPDWRVSRRDLALAALAALVTLLPHLVWLAAHDFITFRHVADIAGVSGSGPDWAEAGRFLVDQLAVMGPIMFPAMLIAMARSRGQGDALALTALAAAPLLIVLAQALAGKALANWAVLYLVPGALLTAGFLASRPRWLLASLAIGGLVSLAMPLVKVMGTGLHLPNGELALARYLGHRPLAEWMLDEARSRGIHILVAADRDILADLNWFGAGQSFAIRAVPPRGLPSNHWQLRHPFDPAEDPQHRAMLILRDNPQRRCPSAPVLARRQAGKGFAQGDSFVLIALDQPSCLTAGGG